MSNAEIDDLYSRARDAGALGGKLTGAGGGGFLLLFVEPDRQADVLAALPGRIRVPFRFDTAGSQIIFYEPQKEYEPAQGGWEAPRPLPFRELVSSDITAEAS